MPYIHFSFKASPDQLSPCGTNHRPHMPAPSPTAPCVTACALVALWLSCAPPYTPLSAPLQWSLARRQPLCFAQLLGTHNSAISLTEGYGMHDDIFTSYLWYLGVVSGPLG